MKGPGIYDSYCTYLREKTHADGAAIMVFGGTVGNGFSFQASPHLLQQIPEVLRAMADQIESDLKKQKH